MHDPQHCVLVDFPRVGKHSPGCVVRQHVVRPLEHRYRAYGSFRFGRGEVAQAVDGLGNADGSMLEVEVFVGQCQPFAKA